MNWCKLVAIRVRFHSEIILWRLQRKQPRLKIYRKKAAKKIIREKGGEGAAHKRHSIKSVSLKSFAGGIATWCSKFYPSSSFRFLLCRRLCLHCCVDIMFVISSPTVPLSWSKSGGDNNAYTFTFPAFSFFLFLMIKLKWTARKSLWHIFEAQAEGKKTHRVVSSDKREVPAELTHKRKGMLWWSSR